MAQEILEETVKDVAVFVKDFAAAYIVTLINSKIEGAIEDAIAEAMPSVLAEEEEEADEKALEDKEEGEILAAGVTLAGYKTGYGPDGVVHRYYDLACWAIRPQDSVITKITYRHRTLMNFHNQLKKKITMPNVPFPQKKMLGKKDGSYYRTRFGLMQTFYDAMAADNTVSLNEEWLTFYKLKFDPVAAERLELFFAALESVATAANINWEYAFRTAQRLGLDMDEVEMLKVVAIAKVGTSAKSRMRDEIYQNSPGFLPGSVKNRFVNKINAKLAAAIGTTVETGWGAAKEGFNQVADGLSDVMDKAVDPLKEMFSKVIGPVKDLIDSKFTPKEAEEDPLDAKLQALTCRRFANVAACVDAIAKGEGAKSACNSLRSSVSDLNRTWKYTPYLQYNCGDPDILEWFPPFENIAEKHQRLTVALIDVTYVLARSLCRAFEPLCEYADKAADSFDEKSHEEQVRTAVREGGKKLAMDYFSLPYTTWRATWWCGRKVTKNVLSFCRATVNRQADLLGSVASTWKPTGGADVKSTLAAALEPALDAFIGDRCFVMISLVRDSMTTMVANLFESLVAEPIDTLAGALDDLVSKLPPPLSDLKPGEIVSGILLSMVEKAAVAAVRKLATPTEKYLADPDAGEPTPWDESLANRFRVAPRIRNDDDDLAAEEEDSQAGDDGEGDKGGDNAADDNKTDG